MEIKQKVFFGLIAGLSVGLVVLFTRRMPQRTLDFYHCFSSTKLRLPSKPVFLQNLPFPKAYASLTQLSDSAKSLLCSHFLYSPVTESTQLYLDKHFPHIHSGLLYVADVQTNGQGRTGSWVNQEGCLMFSFKFSCNSSKVLPLQLAIPIGLIRAIHQLGSSHGIDLSGLFAKYPNDVYLNGKKLAGILVNSISAGKIFVLTIGIGINVNNKTEFASLEKEFPGLFGKGEVLRSFLEEFTLIVKDIEDDQWGDSIVQEYKEKWMHLGKFVKLRDRDEDWVIRDINKQGVIFLENTQGKIEKVIDRDNIIFID